MKLFKVTVRGHEFEIRRHDDGTFELPPELAKIRGQGTGLKPTWEPILVYRKPLIGTLAANVLKHGTGALNIDATRVKHSSPADFEAHKAGVEAIKARGGSMADSWKNSSDLSGASDVTSAGRWPPNVLLEHAPGCVSAGSKQVRGANFVGEDPAAYEVNRTTLQKIGDRAPTTYVDASGKETVDNWTCEPGCPVAELDAQSGNRKATLAGRADPNAAHTHPGHDTTSESMWFGKERTFLGTVYADEGGASRFYPQFQAGCVEGCPVKELDDQSGITTSGAMKHEVEAYEGESNTGFIRGRSGPSNQHGDTGGASRFYPSFEGQGPVEVPFLYTGKATKRETSLDGEVKNDHPTRKPLKLMQWLVKLVTPKGGLCLDPYAGSGSTLHACVEEGVRFVGIEKDPHYHEIATKRLGIVVERTEDTQGQRDLFDEMMDGGFGE